MFDPHTIDDVVFLDRMLDYSRLVHSLPESAVDPIEQKAMFGAAWNRDVCNCKMYNHAHGGCPGPMAKYLPKGWQSGDDVPAYNVDMWPKEERP